MVAHMHAFRNHIQPLLICCLIIICAGCANNIPVKVGDETVEIKQYTRGTGKAFVHLHQSEAPALEAAKYVMRSEGGSILTLAHSGERNVVFHMDSARYEFDPNRIFTDAGIKKTLTQFGNYSERAHQEVKRLAEQIKAHLPTGKIIAVHNNNKSYSFKEYLPKQKLASDARALHFQDQMQYRNFFLVTTKADFLRLKDLQFNSILQVKHPEDDGSLSVFMSNHRYINVEAGYDQLKQQIYMLHSA